jgi:ABC-2 type transport system permease protein
VRDATSGTVFDIGYQRYTGERQDRSRSRRAIYKDGIRMALGRGRGGKAKILPIAFIIALGVVGLFMALVAGAVNRVAGAGAAEKANLPSHSDLYGIASVIVFVFASVVAPELVCRDKREGTINLYLVRPISGTDYIVPRWGAFLTVMTFATWLPQIVLFLGLCLGGPKPADYFMQHWGDIPKFLLAGLVMSTYATSLAMLVASFTNRRAYASVFLVGLFLISTPFTVGLSQEVNVSIGQWISMFNLSNIPVHVNDIIFNNVSEITKDAPAKNLDEWVLVAWYLVWTLGPMAWLWARYRKLST